MKKNHKKKDIRRQKWRSALAVLLLSLPVFLLAGMDFGLFAIEFGERPVQEGKDGRLRANDRQLSEAFELVTKQEFYPGVYVDGIHLGGMTRDQGIEAVQRKAMDFLETIHIKLEARDEVYEVTGSDLGASYNISDAINQAWIQGRQAKDADIEQQILRRYQEIKALESKPFKIEGSFDYDRDYLRQAIETKLSSATVEPTPAKATAFNPGTGSFTISEKIDGITPDIDKAVNDVMDMLENDEFKGKIDVDMETLDTGMTAAEMAADLGYVSEATTLIMYYDPGRDQNLIRSAELINGTILNPGETFSYLDALGPITAANGYNAASILLDDGGYEDALGGGLCQPSTTLFQAAFKADLQIVERYNHGRRSGYYEFGQDAMVYSPFNDFKFRNNTEYPVGIIAIFSNGKLTYRIYGKTLPAGTAIGMRSVKIADIAPGEPVYELDESLEPGTEKLERKAIAGSHWQTYKVYYQNGVETNSVLTNNSWYRAWPALYKEGPKPTPTPTTPPTTAPTTAPTAPAPAVTAAPAEVPEPAEETTP